MHLLYVSRGHKQNRCLKSTSDLKGNACKSHEQLPHLPINHKIKWKINHKRLREMFNLACQVIYLFIFLNRFKSSHIHHRQSHNLAFHVDTCITEITDAPSGLNHLTAHVERSEEREEMKWKLTISLIDICSSREEQTEDGKTNRFAWMEDKKKVLLLVVLLSSLPSSPFNDT